MSDNGVELRDFDLGTDLFLIVRWLTEREVPFSGESDLPRVGKIAFIGGNPVAAGFLRVCEGNACIIDSLVSNPKASPEERHHSIDAITHALIAQAKAWNCNRILAFSIDTGTLERAERHGFVKLPHAVISLSLS